MTASRRPRRLALAPVLAAVVGLLALVSSAAAEPAPPPATAGVAAAVPLPGPPTATAPLRIMPLGDSITLGTSPERSYRGVLWGLLRAAGHDVDFVGSYGNIIPPGGEATWFGPEQSQTAYRGPVDKDFEGHGGFQAGQPESVVGYKDHMLAQMVPTDLPLFAPDVVLVHIGTNDYLGGFTTHGPWHGPGGPGDRAVEYAAKNVIDLVDAITTIRPQATVLVAPIGKAGLNGVQDALAQMSTLVQAAVEQRAAAGAPVRWVGDLYASITPADLADVVHPNDAGYAKFAEAWYRALTPVLAARAAATTSTAPTGTADPPTTGTAEPPTATEPPTTATEPPSDGAGPATTPGTLIDAVPAPEGVANPIGPPDGGSR